jgi:hypothetical protein
VPLADTTDLLHNRGLVEHYFAPTVDWTIAVSRRFHGERAVLLYEGAVLPVLKTHGAVLECQYASDDRQSPDYWIRRINTILAVTDIHVLLDLDRSGYVDYEFDTSEHLARRRRAVVPVTLPNWQPEGAVAILRPRRILITDTNRRDSYSRRKRTFTIGIEGANVEQLQRRLDSAICDAKRRRTNYLRRVLRVLRLLPKVVTESQPKPLAVAEDAYRVALALADGHRVPELANVLELTSPANEANPLFSVVKELVADGNDWHLGLRTGAIAVPSRFRDRWVFMAAFFRKQFMKLLGEEIDERRAFRLFMSLLGFAAALSRSRCRNLVDRPEEVK